MAENDTEHEAVPDGSLGERGPLTETTADEAPDPGQDDPGPEAPPDES